MSENEGGTRAGRKRKHDGDGDPNHTAGSAAGPGSSGSISQKVAAAAAAADVLPSSSSVEDLLSVPLDIILRECAPPINANGANSAAAANGHPVPQRRRALLSKSEASTLLRTSQLATEFNILLDLASDVLTRTRECREFRAQIENGAGGHHYGLRSILPILHYHGNVIPSQTIRHVQIESERVLSELLGCAGNLHQCAEHNWQMSEGLWDLPGGGGLAQEKNAVAEIEEAVCERIEGLVRMASNQSPAAAASALAPDLAPTDEGGRKRQRQELPLDVFEASVDSAGKFVPMRDLCCELLGIEYASKGPANEIDQRAEGTKLDEKEAAVAAAPSSASVADETSDVKMAETDGAVVPSSAPDKSDRTGKIQVPTDNDTNNDDNAEGTNDATIDKSSEPAVSTSQHTSGTDATDGSKIIETSEDEEEAGGRSSSSSSPASSPDGSMGRGVGTQNAAAALAVMASS